MYGGVDPWWRDPGAPPPPGSRDRPLPPSGRRPQPRRPRGSSPLLPRTERFPEKDSGYYSMNPSSTTLVSDPTHSAPPSGLSDVPGPRRGGGAKWRRAPGSGGGGGLGGRRVKRKGPDPRRRFGTGGTPESPDRFTETSSRGVISGRPHGSFP